MSDYKKLVKTEAKKLFETCSPEFDQDSEEFGGQSSQPNFAKWLDRTEKLKVVVEKIVAGWSHKDFLWVQNNTRKPDRFGDLGSNAFGSFYSDVLHELKKLRKASGV